MGILRVRSNFWRWVNAWADQGRHSMTAGEKDAGTNRGGLRGTSSVMVRVVQERNG
jgi:hypothetical protein